MVKQIKYAVILLVVICSSAKSNENLQIAFDAATFNFDVNETRWELYCSTPDNMFTYIKSDDSDKLIGKITIMIKIKSVSGVAVEDKWTIGNVINSTNDLKQNYVFGAKAFLLQPGQYSVELNGFDEHNPQRKVSYNKDIIISKFERNRINQSEIQFASYLEEISKSPYELDAVYMKFDYYIIPNPRAEFYGDKSKLIGLYEVYNSELFAPNGFIRSYKILDNTGLELYYKRDTCNLSSETILTTFEIPMDTLPSGVYFLSTNTIYPLDNPVDSTVSSKKFFFYNQYKPPVSRKYFTENESFEKSEFNTMTPEKTDLELSMALVIAREEEIYQARSLTDTKAKQRFLFKYWAARKKDTLNSWNEELRKFRQNVDFANNFFAYGNNNQGWNTERGRVLLKYGIPTQRDMYLSDGVNRAYEEWFYENVQGGVYFYFVDLSYIGKYQLVHSTAMDEPYNPDWFNRYVPAGADRRIELDMQNQNRQNNQYTPNRP